MSPSLDILIVNWNSGRQLRRCLGSVAAAGQAALRLSRVVVVDNASRDGSADCLDVPTLPLTVVRNRENRGFGAACNQAAAGSAADYLLFLNPDTRLFADSLSTPILAMEQPESARVAVAGVQLVDEQGSIHRSCARFPTPVMFACELLGLNYLFPGRFPDLRMLEWDHLERRRVDHVKGAFFLTRRRVFEALGGFDERYFLYLEDVDFSRRVALAGWSHLYLAEARAFHRGGGTTEQVKGARLCYNLRSRILYGYKHFGWGPPTALLLGTFLVEPVLRLGYALVRGRGDEFTQTLDGFARLWRQLPALLRSAGRVPGPT